MLARDHRISITIWYDRAQSGNCPTPSTQDECLHGSPAELKAGGRLHGLMDRV